MNNAPQYEIVAQSGITETVIATAPLFDDRAKAEAWAANYKKANPHLLNNGAVDIVVRVHQPQP